MSLETLLPRHWGLVMSDLSVFIQDLLQTFNPGLDVTAGSAAYSAIVAPLLAKFGEDILSTDVNSFLANKLKEQFPGMSVESGDAITDILVHAASLYFESYRRELTSIKNNQSMANLDLISDGDADLLAANWLVSRDEGARASGFIRIEFQRPTTFAPGVDAVALTSAGLKFTPAQTTVISAAQMLNNSLPNGNYYVDILIRAENVGVEYNIPAKAIRSIIGVPGAVAAYNLYDFTNGRNGDSTTSLIRDIIPKAITERSLVTSPGVNARVRDDIQGIQRTQVIGFKEPEMNRDLVETSTSGDLVGFGSVIVMGQQAFLYLFHQKDIVSIGDLVRIRYPSTLYVPNQLPAGPETFEITEILRSNPANTAGRVNARHMVVLSGTPFPERMNVFAAIPGVVIGYLEVMKKPTVIVNVDEKIFTYPSGGIHVGGHTDVYGQPHSDLGATTSLTASINSVSGFGFEITEEVGLNQVKLALEDTNREFLKPGNYFCILAGDFQGNYKIRFVHLINALEVSLVLDTELLECAVDDALPWALVDKLRIDIFNPAKVLLPFGGILPLVDVTVGSRIVNTSVNFSSYGVEVGDTLRILESDAAGDYKIESIADATVTLEQIISQSQANLPCEVIRKQEGLLKPLTTIGSIKLETDVIPYGKCLGAEVISLGGSREIVANYTGYVAPSFAWALSTGDGNWDAVADCDYISQNGNERAYSSNPNILDDSYVFTLENLLNGGASEFTQEFFLPKEIVGTEAPNNIFICLGNVSYADLSNWVSQYVSRRAADGSFEDGDEALPDNWRVLEEYYPIDTNLPDPAPVEGGILTINGGINKGSYVINKVWRTYINLGPANTTHRRIPISILQIEGEFPNNPLGAMSALFDRVHRFNNNLIDFGDAIRLFLAPEKFIEDSVYSDRVASAVSTVATEMNIQMTAIFSPTKAKEFLEQAVYCNYSLGAPAQGTLRAYFEDPVYMSFKTARAAQEVLKSVLAENPSYLVITENDRELTLVPDSDLVSRSLYSSTADKRDWNRTLTITNNSAGVNLGSVVPEDNLFDINFELDGRDILEVLPEISAVPSPLQGDDTALEGLGLLKTKRGSSAVTVLRSAFNRNDFRLGNEDIGSYLCIDSGPDSGSYEIIGVDAATRTLTLDAPLTFTTPNIQAYGTGSLLANNTVLFTVSGGGDDNTRSSRPFLASDVGKYITIYNLHSDITAGLVRTVKRMNIGSYQITGFSQVDVDANHYTIELVFEGTIDGGLSFPQDIDLEGISWTITSAPSIEIEDLELGLRDCLGGVTYRIYDNVPLSYYVYDIQFGLDDGAVYLKKLDGSAFGANEIFNYRNNKNPHRWVRYGEYQITAQEMANNTFGSLYYADIPIISLGFGDVYNGLSQKFCTLSNYFCEGYSFEVADKDLTYSTREQTTLVLPVKICPPDENYFSFRLPLVGKDLSVQYTYAPDISLLQAVMDSYNARVMCASMLARRMLPARVGSVIEYTGGISENAMRTFIKDFIDSSSATYNIVSVSSLISVLYGKGATYVKSPIEIIYLVEDLNRDRIMFKSKDAIRYTDSVHYEGTPRITGWKNSEDLLILSKTPTLKTLGV